MPFWGVKPLGYNVSKAALNIFTVNLAWELRDTKAKVSSVCLGYVATDLNNHSGPGTAAEGAIAITKYAQIGDDGPTGASSTQGFSRLATTNDASKLEMPMLCARV